MNLGICILVELGLLKKVLSLSGLNISLVFPEHDTDEGGVMTKVTLKMMRVMMMIEFSSLYIGHL